MIEVKIDKTGIEMHCEGGLEELTAEMGKIINGLYSRMKVSANPMLGDLFREVLTTGLVLPGSPIWEVNPGGDGSLSILVPRDMRCGSDEA